VKPDATAHDGFLVHSFAGDDPMACRDHVRKLLGLTQFEPREKRKSKGIAAKPWSPTVERYVYKLRDGTPHLQVSGRDLVASVTVAGCWDQ
jgi:hypothetical protein